MGIEAMADDARACAPYVPFPLFEAAAEEMGRAMPPRVDRHALPDLSRTDRSRIVVAFRFLGLTDAANVPGQALARWGADPAARPALMREILEDRYASVLALAPAAAPPARMRDEIGKMGVSGDTRKRAVWFFLDAARFAGLRLPPEWERGRTRRERPDDRPANGTSPAPPPPAPPRESERTVDLGAAGTVTLRADVDLVALDPGDREWLFGLLDGMDARPEPLVRR